MKTKLRFFLNKSNDWMASWKRRILK